MALFDRFRGGRDEPVQPHWPDGGRLYCVGDIHGRADLLRELHERIEQDAATFDGRKHVLYVGDFIDRGEDSAEVIEEILGPSLAEFEPICLKGNHEQALLDFLVDPVAMSGWLSWGGRETLRSYGIHTPYLPAEAELHRSREALDRALPDTHRQLMEEALEHWEGGSYYFVHAGIRPGIPLEKQQFEDKLWIRDEFMNSQRNHGAIVVHGHTITEQVDFQHNRIGIDTGAYSTGVLTALVLEGAEQRLIQTGGLT